MTSFIIFSMLSLPSCPNTIVINHTDEWVRIDELNLKQAVKRCPEIYENLPCLKTFIKKKKQTYNAICGAKDE